MTTAAATRTLRGPVRRERPAPEQRQVVRRDIEGNELGTVDLAPAIFGIEPNVAVLHQVVTAQLAAARAGTQSTRTRAEVRGGGAKPYRQKGTGRARQGSTRAPHWSGGGIALGPKPRDYRQRTPKKMVRLALCSALSDRASEGRVALVDRWAWEAPRTKDAAAALGALGISGQVLVVLAPGDEVAERSFANLPEVETVAGGELSAYSVLRSDWVVFTDATLPGAEIAGEAERSAAGTLTAPEPLVEAVVGGEDTPAAPSASAGGEAATQEEVDQVATEEPETDGEDESGA